MTTHPAPEAVDMSEAFVHGAAKVVPPPTLEVRDLSHTFERGTANEVRALSDVNLTLAPGDFVTVVGMNGSGKSTLLNAVAGAFLPDSGQILLDGEDVTRQGEFRRACHVGRVFQDPLKGTAPNLTVAENLSLALDRTRNPFVLRWALTGSRRAELRERVRTLQLGLEDRLDTRIGMLSGGERQALTLLMATLVKPSLLLLDEHTAALDPRSVEQVVKLTERVVSSQRLTTLMVTHSMHQAVQLGDRVLMMHRGRVVREIRGREKQQLRVENLLATFDQLRSMELLDESAADMLRRLYV
ncbi:MAG: transporter related protein [Gemmatimonadetes bacterium]|jgi:putative ABC transport system ATP-binding protein|nr:transporter related protein [Gemmatimonadota bacterium]